jgi:hypothetical protein
MVPCRRVFAGQGWLDASAASRGAQLDKAKDSPVASSELCADILGDGRYTVVANRIPPIELAPDLNLSNLVNDEGFT